MTTYDLTKKTNASTGQTIMPSPQEIRLQNLEDKKKIKSSCSKNSKRKTAN